MSDQHAHAGQNSGRGKSSKSANASLGRSFRGSHALADLADLADFLEEGPSLRRQVPARALCRSGKTAWDVDVSTTNLSQVRGAPPHAPSARSGPTRKIAPAHRTHVCTSVCRTDACAVAKVCLVMSGASRPRWKKAGKTIRLPSSERSEGTTACGGSDVRPSVRGREAFAS